MKKKLQENLYFSSKSCKSCYAKNAADLIIVT